LKYKQERGPNVRRSKRYEEADSGGGYLVVCDCVEADGRVVE
jgi:hypothetical protein